MSVDLQQVVRIINENPYYRHLGMEVVELGKGGVKIRMPLRDELLQLQGVVHGGAIASLADSCAVVASWIALGVTVRLSTVEMKLNYLAPARKGPFIGVGRCIHPGKRIQVAEAEIFDGDQQLIAKGIATSTASKWQPGGLFK